MCFINCSSPLADKHVVRQQLTKPAIAVTEEDRQYIRQALELAKRGLGKTYPNPAVGCVIVKDGQAGVVPAD